MLRHERGVAAADLAAFDNHDPLTSNFVAAAWSRWLTNIVASGFLTSGVFDRARDARAALLALALQSPLVILASDFGPFETFDVAGVPGVAAIPPVAAVPGRRARGGQPAVRAVRAQPGVPGVPASSHSLEARDFGRCAARHAPSGGLSGVKRQKGHFSVKTSSLGLDRSSLVVFGP